MDRRTLLASLALAPAIPAIVGRDRRLSAAAQDPNELVPPDGDINVAVLLSNGAVVIDFCGPWAVFNSVAVGGPHTSHDHRMPFKTYTVAERGEEIRASGGMRIVPDYMFDDAPAPDIVVIPAQHGRSDGMLDWIRTSNETAHVTMSVCTGSFLLASTGLLDGRAATTHHDSYDQFAAEFPRVDVRRGLRFVEQGKLMTAGGLSSGIDAALRVVDRYFGREVAEYTASYMEYQGTGWMI